MSNSSLGMTKEAYLEMCEALGSEPLEEEIPVEYGDLLPEVQEALRIYSSLQDSWDYMGGNYIGKSMVGFKDILDIYEVDQADRKLVYELVMEIDRIRQKSLQEKKQQTK